MKLLTGIENIMRWCLNDAKMGLFWQKYRSWIW